MINWKRDFVSFNTVYRGRSILLITSVITDRNGVHLVLLPLCLTEVHPLFFHTKLCAFFHDFINSFFRFTSLANFNDFFITSLT